jgi:hypothetical protein
MIQIRKMQKRRAKAVQAKPIQAAVQPLKENLPFRTLPWMMITIFQIVRNQKTVLPQSLKHLKKVKRVHLMNNIKCFEKLTNIHFFDFNRYKRHFTLNFDQISIRLVKLKF